MSPTRPRFHAQLFAHDPLWKLELTTNETGAAIDAALSVLPQPRIDTREQGAQ
jgi:hypothetical protein